MSAPTAQALLRQLDVRRAQEQVAELAALDSAHRDEVRRVLGQVKPTGRVDIALLIESVRKSISKRSSEYTPEERAQARASNELWRIECERRSIEVPSAAAYGICLEMQSAAAPASLPAQFDVEPDDLDDDEVDEKPRRASKRRSMPRRRLLRLERHSAKPKPEQQPPKYIGARLLGAGADDRPYGASIDYDPHHAHFPPPWLLPDEPKELDDDDTDEARISA